jgi:hypothetical protein
VLYLVTWVKQPDGERRPDTFVGFHTFRHTCATLLFRNGWNAVQVQRWLGHHKPSFTLDVYIHSLPKDVAEPTFMDAILAGEVGNDGQQRASSAPENTGDSALTVVPQEVPISSENVPESPVLSSAANDF